MNLFQILKNQEQLCFLIVLKKIKLGISFGDFNGIDIEIILKTFLDKRMLDFCNPIIFGYTILVSAYKNMLNVNIPINGIKEVNKAVNEKIILFSYHIPFSPQEYVPNNPQYTEKYPL